MLLKLEMRLSEKLGSRNSLSSQQFFLYEHISLEIASIIVYVFAYMMNYGLLFVQNERAILMHPCVTLFPIINHYIRARSWHLETRVCMVCSVRII